MNYDGSLSVGNPVFYMCSRESMMKQDEAVLKISAFSHKPVTWPSLGGGTSFQGCVHNISSSLNIPLLQ